MSVNMVTLWLEVNHNSLISYCNLEYTYTPILFKLIRNIFFVRRWNIFKKLNLIFPKLAAKK